MGSGLVLHTAGQWARKLKVTKATLNRNTLMLSVLGGGALGMFLFASSTGKGQVHKLHPIFQVGAMPRGDLDYTKKQQQMGQDVIGNQQNDEDADVSRLRDMRAVRRKGMVENLEKGRGFSDAHGGHWYQDEGVDMAKRKAVRAARRRTLNNNLVKGQGLSDSHGGQWST